MARLCTFHHAYPDLCTVLAFNNVKLGLLRFKMKSIFKEIFIKLMIILNANVYILNATKLDIVILQFPTVIIPGFPFITLICSD